MRIKILDLQKGFNKVFDHIKNNGINEVEIEDDFYWNIPEEKRNNINKEPDEFDIGQLSDDWDESLQVINGGKEPLAFSLVWLSSISKVIGEKIVI